MGWGGVGWGEGGGLKWSQPPMVMTAPTVLYCDREDEGSRSPQEDSPQLGPRNGWPGMASEKKVSGAEHSECSRLPVSTDTSRQHLPLCASWSRCCLRTWPRWQALALPSDGRGGTAFTLASSTLCPPPIVCSTSLL